MSRHRFIFVCLLLLLPTYVFAQSVTVSGAVVDTSGGVVPGATVVLTGPGGSQTTVSGAEGEYSFRNVAAGTYQVTVTLAGFASANVAVPRVTLALGTLGETVVVSASRIDTALADAPATMSVVTSETLASTPAQNYADLLRGVPGVNAVQLSARDINLTSRQATTTLSNSELVLVDGRSVYLDFFGLVLWDFVPSNLGDVKQIEVIRGPASAVWGANALTGVVNIITKSPREQKGTNVVLSAGGFSRDAGSGVGKGAG
jgi:outer membrane receptor for ferrienterochelin and colicin